MFDKKNTMILTIVAVATLLVAVVGATFAYFSTGISGGATTTTATVTTATPGSIVIDGGGETLTLKLSAADMMSNNTGTYYALNATDSKDLTDAESIHGGKNSEKLYTIANANIKDGGSDVTYNCGYEVTVKSTSGAISGFTGLTLKLEGPGIGGSGDTTTVDLSNLSTTGTTKTGTFALKGPSGNSTISAGVYLENKTDNGAQNSIAGKTANITIEVKGKECTIMASE